MLVKINRRIRVGLLFVMVFGFAYSLSNHVYAQNPPVCYVRVGIALNPAPCPPGTPEGCWIAENVPVGFDEPCNFDDDSDAFTECGLVGFECVGPGSGSTTCGGVPVSVDVGCDPNTDDPISGYLSGFINFLAGGVVVVVTAMIIMGGFQYIWAHGAPDLIQKAKKQITNAVIALLTFIFIYAFLQWLIPGGLFNRPQADPGCNPNTEICSG